MPDAAGTVRSNRDLIVQIRPELFWDTDPNQLDASRHPQYIIERVAERGTIEEMRAVWRYYGRSRVAEAVMNSRSLGARTVWFFSALLQEPLDSFRSYSPESHRAVTP